MYNKIDFKKIKICLLDLPRSLKIIMSLFVDAILCFITVWISFVLRIGEITPLNKSLLLATVISIIIAFPIFVLRFVQDYF